MEVWLVWNEDPSVKLLLLLMGLPRGLAGRSLIGIYASETKARKVASEKTGYVVERALVQGAQLRTTMPNPADVPSTDAARTEEAGNSEKTKTGAAAKA
jgi:hypothetical protein